MFQLRACCLVACLIADNFRNQRLHQLPKKAEYWYWYENSSADATIAELEKKATQCEEKAKTKSYRAASPIGVAPQFCALVVLEPATTVTKPSLRNSYSF
jgi:hypothetical protein